MQINNRLIGTDHVPFIIAEMSGNHNQSLNRAIEIVEAASKAGVQALKLQTYTADTMTLDMSDREFLISDKDSLWKGKNLYELYKQAYTPWEWHQPIMQRANELGMTCFSSPFDESAVDFLEELNVPAYKIASFENNHLPLIRKVASTGKPVIISTGMATIVEIGEAVAAAREAGCKDLILLKCTSTYPATPESSNVLTIPHMRELFDCEVGLSDHTMGIGASIAAVAHGATVIEKHFTLDRLDGGVDSAFSLEPHELELLTVETERAWQSMGRVIYGGVRDEEKSKIFKRSIYIVKDMVVGDVFTEENIRIIRPGNGLPPKDYDHIIGQSINCSAKKGTPVSWNILR
jgi:N-acetylneuraminate synthase